MLCVCVCVCVCEKIHLESACLLHFAAVSIFRLHSAFSTPQSYKNKQTNKQTNKKKNKKNKKNKCKPWREWELCLAKLWLVALVLDLMYFIKMKIMNKKSCSEVFRRNSIQNNYLEFVNKIIQTHSTRQMQLTKMAKAR